MNRETWLDFRKNKIGGSDAAAILGLNPYKTNVQLWREKVGLETPQDISDKEVVQYGIAYEPLLIQSFAIDFPDAQISHKDYDIETNSDRPWQVGSFDARLIDARGRHGVFEAKTSHIRSAAQLDAWNNKVPDNYFCQILHYFSVNPAFEFAHLRALLKMAFRVDLRIEIRDYDWERICIQDQIDYLTQREIEFIERYIIPKKEPPLILPEI